MNGTTVYYYYAIGLLAKTERGSFVELRNLTEDLYNSGLDRHKVVSIIYQIKSSNWFKKHYKQAWVKRYDRDGHPTGVTYKKPKGFDPRSQLYYKFRY